MSRLNWFDRLWAIAHPGQADTDVPVEGLVLSGGGSRASFHLGALRYLYDKAHIAPSCIVATSAGSIIGTALAQSQDPAEQSEVLRTVEQYWLAMSNAGEMFAEQTWFTRLREQWESLSEVVPDLRTEPDPLDPGFYDANDSDAATLMREALDFDPSANAGDFSLSKLWQFLSALPRLGRAGAGLASMLRGAEIAASAYRPGSLAYRLLFESGFTTEAVRESGMQLRIAFVGLNSGDLHFMRQDGVIVDPDDKPVLDTPFDLTMGVWASCSIPGVFRPVKLGDELYVDGGVRDNVPVEMAVDTLGVTRPYVIVATPPGVAPPETDSLDILSIMFRSFSIVMDEMVRNEVSWARRAGAVVIEPLINVHSPLVVDQALLRINRDYGWMRAAEEMTGAEAGTTGPIVEARLELNRCLSEPEPDEEKTKKARRHVRALLEEADPALLPEGYDSWPDEPGPKGTVR